MCMEVNWLHNQLSGFHDPNVFHFHYQGFSWVRHFPWPALTEIELIVMLFAAIFLAAGLWFRASAIVFTILYSHFFLAEAAAYNNHFYLIILISGLLACTGAASRFSVDEQRRMRKGGAAREIPFWNYAILRIQVIIVYFYGAVAKLNRDWLVEYEPVRFWMNHSKRPPAFLKEIITQDWFTPLTAWGGLLIDLICPFLLLWRKTKVFAMVVLVIFHVINSQIFTIGNFPLIGMILLIPFLSPRSNHAESGGDERSSTVSGKLITSSLLIFFAFQMLYPLRWHLWRPANPLWTEKGQRFAWMMMLREKPFYMELVFPDKELKKWIEDRPWVLPDIAPPAYLMLCQNPTFIWEYVQTIRENLEEYGWTDVAIHVIAACSLNGRPYYPLINPHVNLAEADCPVFSMPRWIVHLPELKVDFEQNRPFEARAELARKAVEDWVVRNPGPASTWIQEQGD